MKIQGTLLKMASNLAEVVQYTLSLGDNELSMNDLLDKEIKLRYMNEIYCIRCGSRTKTSFGQGFCYNCFMTAPEADPAIIRPELDKAHLGISRDMEWAKKYSLQDHYVYLAVTGGIKVGVTRSSQVITRWIDQGASSAVKIAKTPYRNLAGLIEVELKKFYPDKTNWRVMLTSSAEPELNLLSEKSRAISLLPDELNCYQYDDDEITKIKYPLSKSPANVKSLSFDKTNEYKGILKGIKGQYLVFNDNVVLNIRNHNGYLVEVEF